MRQPGQDRSHRGWYPKGWVASGDSRQKQGLEAWTWSAKPGDQAWKTPSQQLLTATQSLPHWPWGFTKSKGGPEKSGKSHTVKEGSGEETATEDRARVWASHRATAPQPKVHQHQLHCYFFITYFLKERA